MTRSDVRGGSGRKARDVFRAALTLLGAFAVGNVLHACVIEERPFDEHLANCKEYCDLALDKCRGADAVYPNLQACMGVCDQMERGDADGGAAGNTLSCRLQRLRKPIVEPGDCPAVGPGGGGVCGNDCESFCSLRREACGALNPKAQEFADPAYCKTACSGLQIAEGFNFETNRDSDTFECRMSYLSEAFADQSRVDELCRSSQLEPDSRNPCWDGPETSLQDDCKTYCHVVMKSCVADYQVYESEAQCNAVCGVLAEGLPEDQGSNTVRCRRYHAYAAFGDAAYHCTHAGPTGDGHCQDGASGNCESYCRISSAACSASFTAQYGVDGVSSCFERCSRPVENDGTRPAVVDDTKKDGFSDDPPALGPRYSLDPPPTPDRPLQCRTFYAVRALEQLKSTPSIDNSQACVDALGGPDTACP